MKQLPHYISGFEYLKVMAAFGVVWIHGSDTNSLARSFQTYTAFAVPCFILISAVLTQKNLFDNSNAGYFRSVGKRFQRLVPAYLAWSLIYVLMRWAKHQFVTHTPLEINWFSIVFFGTASYQLWYVPALLLWTILFLFIMICLASTSKDLILKGVLMVATGCVLVGVVPHIQMIARVLFGNHVHQFAQQMPIFPGYICLGIGLWLIAQKFFRQNAARLQVLSFLSGIGLIVTAFFLKPDYLISRYFIMFYSIGLLIACLFLELPSLKLFRKYLAPCSFGIYLCHGLFVEGLQVAVALTGLEQSSFVVTAGVIGISFICSAVLCAGLMATKATRWMVV